MFTLRLFGGFALLDPAGEKVRRLSHRRAEAVLALLAIAGPVGCTRDRLIGLLWPESTDPLARHSLRDALHAIRQAVHSEVLLTVGDTVALNPALISTDVGQFREAREAGRLAEAEAAYRGPFLEGFHLDEAPDFEHWCEDQRARLFHECALIVESLARQAQEQQAWDVAAGWWQRAAEHDPHNSRVVIRLMRALANAGDRANALLRAEAHRKRLWQELEIAPDDEFEAAVAELRAQHNGREAGRVVDAVRSAAGTPEDRWTVVEAVPDSQVATVALVPHAADAPAHGQEVAPVVSGRHRRHRRLVVVVAASIALGGAAALWWRASATGPAMLDPDRIAVVPFTSGDGASRTAEAEAIRGFIIRELQSGPTPNAMEPAVVNRAWTAARSEGDPLAVDADVSRRTGASLVLRGQMDSTIAGRTLTLTISRFPARRVEAQRSVVVSATDLSTTVRRLLIEVLALEAGEPEHRLATLSRHSLAALRPYFEHIRQREAKQRCPAMVRAVWRVDSSLIYPGLPCLAMDGYYVGSHAFLDTIAFTVWRRRSGLPVEDSAYVEALVGPWFGRADNAEQRIALWREAAAAAPRWWIPWMSLARELVMFGPRTTLMAWRRDAEAANARALELTQWSQEGPVEMAFWLGIFRGDSASSRRALEASKRFDVIEPQRTHFGTNYYWWGSRPWPWIYDAAFGNGKLVIPEGVPLDSLIPRVRILSVLAQARRGTTRYLDTLLLRWERQPGFAGRGFFDWWVAAYWHTRGDYARWRVTRQRIDARRFRGAWPEYNAIAEDAHEALWEVLHLGAPEDTVFRLRLARMKRVLTTDTQPPPGPVGVAACWVTLWRLSHDDTSGAGRAIRILRNLEARDRSGAADGLPTSGRWVRCPALIEAHRARITKRGALESARAYDLLLQPLPVARRGWWFYVTAGNEDGLAAYNESLDAAWLLAAAGDTAGALAAVRRRPRWSALMLDFHFTPAQHLRLEGRLAAATSDTLGAIEAYEDYLALRPTPPAHPPWRAEWDSVRAELARLKPRP